jgi:hypothetical protein
VVPNTLVPALGGLDWTAMRRMFKDCLAPPMPMPAELIPSELNSSEINHPCALDLASLDLVDTDSAMKNLIGDSAELEAQKWADDGSMRRRLDVLRGWLGPRERGIIDQVLGRLPRPRSQHGDSALLLARDDSAQETSNAVNNIPVQVKRYNEDSDDSSDDEGSDAHARTAHMFFAEGLSEQLSLQSCPSSSPSQSLCERVQIIDAESFDSVQAADSGVGGPVSEQTNDTMPVPVIPLSIHRSLPTPVSSPVLRPLVSKGKGKEREREFSLSPSFPPAITNSLPSPVPRISDSCSQIHPYIHSASSAFIILDEVGEDNPLTPALSDMSMSACTSPFASFEDIEMSEAGILSLPGSPGDNCLKLCETRISPIHVREDATPEFCDDQRSPQRCLQKAFLQRSPDAQPFESISNHELSHHQSSSPASHHQSQSQSQSQQTSGHRRKRRRLEGYATDVPETENGGVVHAPSLISTLRRRRTEESVTTNGRGSESVAYPRYRSRAPSPDPFLDVSHVADEIVPVSPSCERQQRRHALRSGGLAPNRSAPSIISPLQLPAANHHSRSAISSASALVTLNSPRALAPAPTIPLLSGITPSSSFASTSNISRPTIPLSPVASSSKILQPIKPPFVVSAKSSASRLEERRKQREIAEKLCLARPDMVDPHYAARRARRLRAEAERSLSMVQDTSAVGSSSSFDISVDTHGPPPTTHRRELRSAAVKRPRALLDEDMEDVHHTMNRERNQRLSRDVANALAAGRKVVDVLPRLMCVSARGRHLQASAKP